MSRLESHNPFRFLFRRGRRIQQLARSSESEIWVINPALPLLLSKLVYLCHAFVFSFITWDMPRSAS